MAASAVSVALAPGYRTTAGLAARLLERVFMGPVGRETVLEALPFELWLNPQACIGLVEEWGMAPLRKRRETDPLSLLAATSLSSHPETL